MQFHYSFLFEKSAGRRMIYGNMPMMIFILASGYLFSVYLLLALAKRTGKKSTSRDITVATTGKHKVVNGQ